MKARKYMRHTSKKTAALKRQTKQARKELIASVVFCECCLRRYSEVVHEIANGADRQKALDKRYATLALCTWCNSFEMEGKRTKAQQLKMLLWCRPDDFDLEAFHKLRGSSPSSITMDDVRNAKWNPADIKFSDGWVG